LEYKNFQQAIYLVQLKW